MTKDHVFYLVVFALLASAVVSVGIMIKVASFRRPRRPNRRADPDHRFPCNTSHEKYPYN